MGLTDEMVEGYWRWTSTSNVTTFTNWHPGQPDNFHGTEDCAMFNGYWGGEWDDHPCNFNATPLCEKRFIFFSYLPYMYTPGGDGTLKFYVYIGEADLLGGQNFEFPYFWGFSEKIVLFFRVVIFLWIFFGVIPFLNYFFRVICKYFLGFLHISKPP